MRPGPGLVSSSVLTGTTLDNPALGWPDTCSGLGDGRHPRELWLGKELEPQRAGGVCTLAYHRWWLKLAVSVPFTLADLTFCVDVGCW